LSKPKLIKSCRAEEEEEEEEEEEKEEEACFYSVQNSLSSNLLSEHTKIKIG
jgi:hypothetical protein